MIQVECIHENMRNQLKEIDLSNVTEITTPSFSGIVTGDAKGKLWINDMEKPSLALAWSYCVDSYAFLGQPLREQEYQDLKNFIYQDFFPKEKQRGSDYFEFSIESTELQKDILRLFQGYQIEQEIEYQFCTYELITKEIILPSGYEIISITKDLWNRLKHHEIKNEEMIIKRMSGSWWSFDDFNQYSLGYCVIHQNKVVAVIFGSARFQNVIPIDIETIEEERGRGLATALGTRFIQGCLKRGLLPQWDCVESNPISYELARKLGFRLFHENTVYWFQL